MRELAVTLALMLANVALPYAITRWDCRRLDAPGRARAWNAPSWASAVVFFGPLCLPAHFWRTRRSARGLLMGIGWMGAVFALELALVWALDSAG